MPADPPPARGPLLRPGFLPAIVVMGALIACAQVHRQAGAVMAGVLREERGLDPATIGGIAAVLFLASACVQVPVGLALDRFGPKRTILTLVLIGISGLTVFALAEGATGLWVGRALIGVGFASTVGGAYVIAARWTPSDRLATVTALQIAVAGAVGGMLATTPLALALARWGWVATFSGVAVATAVIWVLVLLLVRDSPPELAARPRRRESLGESLAGLLALLRHPELRRVLVMGTCFAGPYFTVAGLWAGPYLVDLHAMTPVAASGVVLAMVAAQYAGTLAYGPLDRLLNTRKRVVLGGAALIVAALLGLIALPAGSPAAATGFLLLLSVVSPFFVTLAAHARAFVPVEATGRAITSLNLVGITGIFTLQGATGLVVDAFAAPGGAGTPLGYRLVFALVAASVAAAAAVYLRVRDAPPLALASEEA